MIPVLFLAGLLISLQVLYTGPGTADKWPHAAVTAHYIVRRSATVASKRAENVIRKVCARLPPQYLLLGRVTLDIADLTLRQVQQALRSPWAPAPPSRRIVSPPPPQHDESMTELSQTSLLTTSVAHCLSARNSHVSIPVLDTPIRASASVLSRVSASSRSPQNTRWPSPETGSQEFAVSASVKNIRTQAEKTDLMPLILISVSLLLVSVSAALTRWVSTRRAPVQARRPRRRQRRYRLHRYPAVAPVQVTNAKEPTELPVIWRPVAVGVPKSDAGLKGGPEAPARCLRKADIKTPSAFTAQQLDVLIDKLMELLPLVVLQAFADEFSLPSSVPSVLPRVGDTSFSTHGNEVTRRRSSGQGEEQAQAIPIASTSATPPTSARGDDEKNDEDDIWMTVAQRVQALESFVQTEDKGKGKEREREQASPTVDGGKRIRMAIREWVVSPPNLRNDPKWSALMRRGEERGCGVVVRPEDMKPLAFFGVSESG
ncbi:hypothetical protein B0H15DRAFT_183767 [Mycena belliarum]|uniref:Uncharacterized protein n=1 Tax=Mycena belliarum TaxID=1033014 RepID=A0AAD6U8K7_9AGAR|nr:hypothetical protein B0H15DRAFT_183767 [Mycena belliae]